MPYDQAALYRPCATASGACDKAIKSSLRSYSAYTWTNWDLMSYSVINHSASHFSWTVWEAKFGHQCHQKRCFHICISFIILLGQLRVVLQWCPERYLQPVSQLTGTEPGAVCSLGGALTFGMQAVARLTLQAFLEEWLQKHEFVYFLSGIS